MSAENLTREQSLNVLRFLLHRSSPETRRALMAEMPVAYARLHPFMDPAVLAEAVTAAIAEADAGRVPA